MSTDELPSYDAVADLGDVRQPQNNVESIVDKDGNRYLVKYDGSMLPNEWFDERDLRPKYGHLIDVFNQKSQTETETETKTQVPETVVVVVPNHTVVVPNNTVVMPNNTALMAHNTNMMVVNNNVLTGGSAVITHAADIRQCTRSNFTYSSTIDGLDVCDMNGIESTVKNFNETKQMPPTPKSGDRLCCSLFLTLCVLAFVVLSVSLWPIVPFVGLLFVCWITYLCEACCFAPSAKYLRNKESASLVYQRIQKQLTARPHIHWKVTCSHKETRGHGDDKKTVTVVTKTVEAEYVWSQCKDVSVPFSEDYLKYYPLSKLKVHKAITFGDARTEIDYYQKAEIFRASNDNGDTSQSFSAYIQFDREYQLTQDTAQTSKILVEGDVNRGNCFSKDMYNMFVVCMCAYCFRWCLSRTTENLEYVVKKEILL